VAAAPVAPPPAPAPATATTPPALDGWTAARELWARRAWVAVAIAAAIACGLLVADQRYSVHEAEADILVDTQSSQVVDLGASNRDVETTPDIETLATRARLLGNLMASGPLKQAIAAEAGIRPELLVVVPPASTLGGTAVPVAPAASRKVPERDATRLTLTADETLPILHATAQAPDGPTAEGLAHGAVTELEKHLGSLAAEDSIPEARRLVVSSIGVQGAVTVDRGPSAALIGAVVIAVLVASCGLIVLVPRLLSNWRPDEEAEAGDAAAEQPPPPRRLSPEPPPRSEARPAARAGGH
jgi:hypothetical protein